MEKNFFAENGYIVINKNVNRHARFEELLVTSKQGSVIL